VAERSIDIFCPVCGSEFSQFNDGYITNNGGIQSYHDENVSKEKIECGYCKSKYTISIIANYKITRKMQKKCRQNKSTTREK